jgi:uncharacterized protein with GYD domain
MALLATGTSISALLKRRNSTKPGEPKVMAKYLIQANYVGEGIKGLIKEGGTSRRAVVQKLFESLGGRLEAFYYAFGDTDAFIIADIPNNVTASALLLTVNSTGAVACKTTVLITPEEVDEAVKMTPSYRPPGQ